MALSTFIPPSSSGSYFNDGTQEAHKPRVLTAGFGDGYAQELADGLNTDLMELTPSWRNVPEDAANTTLAFFKARAGFFPFLFTLPGESSPRKFKCTEWSRTFLAAGGCDVMAIWKEVP